MSTVWEMSEVCRRCRSRIQSSEYWITLCSHRRQIRQFSIENLSDITPRLTDREKIALSRQHKVAKWLVEGLVGFASKLEKKEISGDELEACVGLQCAYRLATLALRLPGRYLEPTSQGSSLCNIGSIYCPLCDHKFFNLDPCSNCGKDLSHTGAPNVTFERSVQMRSWASTGEMEGRSDQEFLRCSACTKHPRQTSLLCGHCSKRPESDEVRIKYVTLESAVEDLFCDEIEEYNLIA